MGSSYFPSSSIELSYGITGPTGPTGDKGNTGPTGFGATGNTGISVLFVGVCGDKLRTTFNDGTTFETKNSIKGSTGNTRFFLGISSTTFSVFNGRTASGDDIFAFRSIKGRTSSSGRVEVIVGLTGLNAEHIRIDYINKSSGFTLGISGSSTINTFVGYSGSTFISIAKTIQGESSSFLTSNVFEKARGMGFSGSTNSSGATCNYIIGGTIGYLDSSNRASVTGCQFVYIDPDCSSSNSIDVGIRNKVFVSNLQGKIGLVRIGKSFTNKPSAITLILEDSENFSASFVDKKKFDVHGYSGSIIWPFNREPCFCGKTGTNVYHFTNLGGNTWYGSVAYMTNPNLFWSCSIPPVGMLGITFGACCVDDGTPGGTCSYEAYGDCLRKGSRVFWHSGLTCGSGPCSKTGGCSMMFTTTSANASTLCINGITCIDCISGNVRDPYGNTYNAYNFTYLGNGVTCITSNYTEEP